MKDNLLLLYTIGAIILLSVIPSSADSQVLINELSASNSTQIEDPDFNEYPDWFELYNPGTSTINLKGYYLTDNFDNPDKWQITEDLLIAGGGFALFWADDRDTANHTSFKLSAEGEELAIYSPTLVLQDSVTYGSQRTDISIGRISDGADVWGYFPQATPNSPNLTSSFNGFADNVPTFSTKGGFYTGPFSVTLENDLGGEIRYTTDGSQPKENSTRYSEPVAINTSTVLRARIFKPDLIPGPTVTQTYFINENSVDGVLPVVSLATEDANFWDPVEGIYVQDFKPAWEVPVNIELFENNGSDRSAFNETAGIKINGLWSWQLPQKMLGVYFRKQYGSGNLDYPMINQRKRNSYKSFSLRASGSDWSYTMFRDILGHSSTLQNMDIEIMGFKPAIVYVNTEYMGIHNIREKVDDDYIEKSYHLEPGSFDMVENQDYAEAGNLDAYKDFMNLVSKDLWIQSNYDEVASVMDIENFTDYVITEMAVGNTSIDHNVMAWKPKEGGKWRWILMDVDRGFFSPSGNLIDFYQRQDVWPFNDLLSNNEYRSYFGRRLADQLYTSFNPDRMIALINEHQMKIEKEIPRHIEKWYGTTSSYGDAMPSVEYWYEEVEDLRSFVRNRPVELLNDLLDYGFSGIVNFGLSVYPEDAGTIWLNNLEVPGSSCYGPYLEEESLVLSTKNKPGYNFTGWTISSPDTIIALESDWRYSDTGTDPGAGWTTSSFDDASWSEGQAQLGYGDGDENTVISYGGSSQDKNISSYFRKSFTLSEQQMDAISYNIHMLCDDGAVVYINGKEAFRTNMPAGEIGNQTTAAVSVSGDEESMLFNYPLDRSLLKTGENILAVEVHQYSGTSSDVSFDLELICVLPGSTVISTDNTIDISLTGDAYMTALFERTDDCILPKIISDNLTLSKECSPYLAQSDVTIAENAILTIDPGVEIWMPESASIHVSGIIQANGTDQEDIVFKLNPEYGNTSWGILSFKNTPAPSVLSYVTIEGASKGADPVNEIAAISAFHADLLMDNMIIRDVEANPITARYSDITLTNSQLRSRVTGDLINVKYGKARVENCTFEGSDQPDNDAIDYDEVENGIIRNCIILNFTGSNSDAIDIGENASNVLIDSITVFNITDKGVSIGQRSTGSISNSVFINCTMGVALKDSSTASIDRCVFYNTVDAIACYEKNPGRAGGNARISNSIISNVSDSSFFIDSKSTLESSYCLTDKRTAYTDETHRTGNPLFSNPTHFDFSLKTGSPAIQSGNFQGAPVDMGTIPAYTGFQPSVMINQIYVNPDNLDYPEFISLYNPSDRDIDISGYAITRGITISLPEGTILGAYDTVYLTNNTTPVRWSQEKQVLQWEEGHLSNNGESLQLEDRNGIVLDYLNYQEDGYWPAEGFAGTGVFQLISPDLDNHFPESWTWESLDRILNTPRNKTIHSVSVYPNPASEFFVLALNLDAETMTEIRFIDLTGKERGSFTKRILPPGQHMLEFTCDQFKTSSSMLIGIIRMEDGSGSKEEYVKIMIQ